MHTMKSKKTSLLLSTITFTVMLAMCMGFTFAWMTDTEQSAANFQAGIVNVVLNGQDNKQGRLDFTDLQPVSLERLDAMALEDLHNAKMFQKLQLENTGTIPVSVTISLAGEAPCGGAMPYVVSDTGEVVPAAAGQAYACKNDLSDLLQVLLYDAEGKRIVDVDLLQGIFESVDEQKIEIPAGEQRTFYIAGLLPLSAPLYRQNADGSYTMYQGGHYHASLVVTAQQQLYEQSGSDTESGALPVGESSELPPYFNDGLSSASAAASA